jgi:hypothetical protein
VKSAVWPLIHKVATSIAVAQCSAIVVVSHLTSEESVIGGKH